ncbi:ABC transporter substrate-binding protein [Bosea sp. NBC_00550]|uniref:ABC transporter substrate-binding protein n=1 Tax=Bosea sp. NBC_00550 TaxID=2969621 RepID=UPI002232B3A8|nr:ABC transporter substrate-binding protein [Bosea sp. NBC_00550]UZF95458.1 ABC transporter substrate-binding protein [Bosea sp. NBC_00550]
MNATKGYDAKPMPQLSAIALLAAAMSLPGAVGARADDGKPVPGGTVIAALNSTTIPNLNTQMTSSVPALFAADVWADGLMTYDRDANRLPRLATSWTISEDGKTYTFAIREGVKWSDGKPFTAADVVFTLESFGKFNTYLTKLMPLVEKASAPDDKTFVLTLKEPLTATLDLFDKEVFPLMPKHIYEGKDVATHPTNIAPVGLGPFKFEKWASGQSITFVRNPHYWEAPKPYLDSVIFALIPNPQQRLNAIVNGEVNWFRPEVVQVPATQQAAKRGTFRVVPIMTNAPETAVIDFNLRRAPMNNVKVRQALFHAIDRQRIVQDVYQGLAETAKNAIPTQFKQLHDPSVNYDAMYAYDPKKAAQLLDEAGFPLKDGKRFAIELAVISAPPYDAVAQVVQAQWTALGIDVKLSSLDLQIWTNKVYTQHDFDASIISLTGRSNPVLGVDRSFVCNQTNVPFANPTGYCNPEFDKVAADAASAPLDRQKALYKTYAEIVARDLNQLALTNARVFEAVTNNFKNLDAQFNFSFNTHPNWAEAWLPKDKQ